MSHLLGHVLTVTLEGSAPFTATLYAIDGAVLIFRASPAHTYLKAEYRLVPAAALAASGAGFVDGGPSTETLPAPRAATDGEAQRRLNDALALAARRAASRNAGVSAEAQALFDGLNKTMDCVWNADQIIVLGTVVVNAPYEDGNVGLLPQKDKPQDREAYARVKTVVRGWRGGGGERLLFAETKSPHFYATIA